MAYPKCFLYPAPLSADNLGVDLFCKSQMLDNKECVDSFFNCLPKECLTNMKCECMLDPILSHSCDRANNSDI